MYKPIKPRETIETENDEPALMQVKLATSYVA